MNNLTVTVSEQTITMPTYEVGLPDKNPMFLEKRVYQGSSGRVYPYPVIDKIYDEKKDKEYKVVVLENDYLRVVIMPELGGRIQRAYDKTNNYDFVYYNEVIKPALVGLTGPWISGGIEFNWPQHHRPTTYAATDYTIQENFDGSKSVRVHEIDQMYGTKGSTIFTLYPDKAYIEIKGQVYNRTPFDQTFLWWANPAIAVHDDTQSIFPPDVNAVMDHGKRAVSKFPIATGTYYKYDYGEGVDISRYKNIPVPTSYMAYHSDYNFVGGYDYKVDAGILHVADHHISPGKKQWTWGCGDFGKAWDKNLTDENGPYIELMTGMFTDNQPDFTWLKPFEEKTFTQYFMPYKQVGVVKNANTDIVIGLDYNKGTTMVTVYGSSEQQVEVVLKAEKKDLLREKVTVSPTSIYKNRVAVSNCSEYQLELCVYNLEGQLLLNYAPEKPEIKEIPEPAQAAKLPAEIGTIEELFLTGLHLEQYRHATYLPDDYYLEALNRDPGDIRSNTAYGYLLLRRGKIEQSIPYFRKAITRLTWKNPNPYDGEAYCGLGLALFYHQDYDKAFDAFYKAIWNNAQQEMAFYYLAAISARRKEYSQSLEFLEKALVKNFHNIKARGLKATILRLQGKKDLANAQLKENLIVDPFDYISHIELAKLDSSHSETQLAIMRGKASSYLVTATDYADFGLYDDAIYALKLCTNNSPLLKYYEAFYLSKAGQFNNVPTVLDEASKRSPYCCFPNRLEEIAILEFAIEQNPKDGKAPYYLGNLFYDKRQYEIAQHYWEQSVAIDPSFATPWRNLSLSYYNKSQQKDKAREALERAFQNDPTDSRVFSELDQLYKKIKLPAEQRLANLEKHIDLVKDRDDLYTEYVLILNLLGQYQKAYDLIMQRKFHPWEGGEGKVTTQYTTALVELAKKEIEKKNYPAALSLLEKTLVFPDNLSEGKLAGAKDNNVYYWMGICYEKMNNIDEATECWTKALEGEDEPAGMMYYYDQPADMIFYKALAHQKLGNEKQARTLFHKLIDYGEEHLFDNVIIDYFAVSLPDLLLFDEDLNQKNTVHCQYLMGLGSYGLLDTEKASFWFNKVVESDPFHLNAQIHKNISL